LFLFDVELENFGKILFDEEGVDVAVEDLAAFVGRDGVRDTTA